MIIVLLLFLFAICVRNKIKNQLDIIMRTTLTKKWTLLFS